MKKCFLMVLAACAFALTACEDEQSSYSLKDCAGKAIVTGRVTVDEGAAKVNGVTVSSNIAPAAGAQVVLTVDYSAYGKGTESGSKQYFATVDANGFYSIEVPVGIKPLASGKAVLDVIIPEGVSFPYGEIVEDNIVNVANPVFTAAANTAGQKLNDFALEANKTVGRDIKLSTANKVDANAVTNKSVAVKGVLKIEAAKWKNSADVSEGSITDAVLAPDGTQVKITLSSTDASDKKELTYYVTTKDGAYSGNFKFYDTWEYNKVKVTAEAVAFYAGANSANQYSHLYTKSEDASKGLTQSLTGAYKKVSTNQTITIGALAADVAVSLSPITMTFVPDDQIVNGITRKKYGKKDDGYTYTEKNPHLSTADGWKVLYNNAGRDDQY